MMDPESGCTREKILVRDKRSDLTLEELCNEVLDMELRSDVPESIRCEFKQAQNLVVFSFFRYEFLTLAVRSALFAYEGALKAIYVQALGDVITIKSNSKIISKFTRTTYREIEECIHTMKKKSSHHKKSITVNDEKFPLNMESIENWLKKNGLPKEYVSHGPAARHLRNRMAHVGNPFILTLSDTLGIMKKTMNTINKMFDHYA